MFAAMLATTSPCCATDIQLRPVTYRGVCDLTHLKLTIYSRNERLFRRFVIFPAAACPIPKLADAGMISRSVLPELWNTCLHCTENFLRKGFPRIDRISLIPSCLSKYPSRRQGNCKCRSQKHDQQARRKRLLIRNARRIKNLHNGNFFDFLDFG